MHDSSLKPKLVKIKRTGCVWIDKEEKVRIFKVKGSWTFSLYYDFCPIFEKHYGSVNMYTQCFTLRKQVVDFLKIIDHQGLLNLNSLMRLHTNLYQIKNTNLLLRGNSGCWKFPVYDEKGNALEGLEKLQKTELFKKNFETKQQALEYLTLVLNNSDI